MAARTVTLTRRQPHLLEGEGAERQQEMWQSFRRETDTHGMGPDGKHRMRRRGNARADRAHAPAACPCAVTGCSHSRSLRSSRWRLWPRRAGEQQRSGESRTRATACDPCGRTRRRTRNPAPAETRGAQRSGPAENRPARSREARGHAGHDDPNRTRRRDDRVQAGRDRIHEIPRCTGQSEHDPPEDHLQAGRRRSDAYVFPASSFSFPGAAAKTVIPITAPLGESTDAVRHPLQHQRRAWHGPRSRPSVLRPDPAVHADAPNSRSAMNSRPTLWRARSARRSTTRAIATNTGNTPLTFTGFSDPGCDGIVAGGGKGVVGPRGSLTFVCTHVADRRRPAAGAFANAASVTGAPEESQGEPVTQVSRRRAGDADQSRRSEIEPSRKSAPLRRPPPPGPLENRGARLLLDRGALAARAGPLRARCRSPSASNRRRGERDVLHRRAQACAAHRAQCRERPDLAAHRRRQTQAGHASPDSHDHDGAGLDRPRKRWSPRGRGSCAAARSPNSRRRTELRRRAIRPRVVFRASPWT